MFASSRRNRSPVLDIWPGFVDALASLLMVIIFVLMTFVMAQYYLSDALNTRDQTLAQLNERIAALNATLILEKKVKDSAHQKNIGLQNTLTSLQEKLTQEQNTAKVSIEDLNAQIISLKFEMSELNKKSQEELLQKMAELGVLNQHLSESQVTNLDLKTAIDALNKKLEGDLVQYRSEFFARLKQVIGDRQDIHVVGDRFVFQSEVLFSRASAELGPDGKKQLDSLIKALKEISATIPKNINWVLRVDGHTDQLPIKTTQFPSNWELSSARAISVVQYMISQGIDPHRLVAAGFGEFQPLSNENDEKSQARNRRIEFKLDQR